MAPPPAEAARAPQALDKRERDDVARRTDTRPTAREGAPGPVDRSGMPAAGAALQAHAARMERMYRLQRHVYNATRKYYLLGRDRMLTGIAPQRDETVIEIGCGTGRNLIWLAQRFPHARLYGVDASASMLESARTAIRRHRVGDRVQVAPAMAETVDPQALFSLDAPADHIVFSYALSMIPDWRAALDRACALLPPGGSLHIADFGDFGDCPALFRRSVVRWLDAFGVHHRPELIDALRAWAASSGAQLEITFLYARYAWIARAHTRS